MSRAPAVLAGQLAEGAGEVTGPGDIRAGKADLEELFFLLVSE
jgi:hypothetical protein